MTFRVTAEPVGGRDWLGRAGILRSQDCATDTPQLHDTPWARNGCTSKKSVSDVPSPGALPFPDRRVDGAGIKITKKFSKQCHADSTLALPRLRRYGGGSRLDFNETSIQYKLSSIISLHVHHDWPVILFFLDLRQIPADCLGLRDVGNLWPYSYHHDKHPILRRILKSAEINRHGAPSDWRYIGQYRFEQNRMLTDSQEMQNTQITHYFLMGIAILLEVSANIFIKYSDGFKKRTYGMLGIISILASFTALSQAIKGIDLSVAYALWGGMGILLTALAGWVLFKQRLNRLSWSGITAIIFGVLILEMS